MTAQKLRYLEILFIDPWTIRIGPDKGVPLPSTVDLHVANPASFIVQKLLIREVRTPAKRAQDVLYIHDTLELFAGALSGVTDTIRDAARMAPGRNLSPERLQGLCQGALREVIN